MELLPCSSKSSRNLQSLVIRMLITGRKKKANAAPVAAVKAEPVKAETVDADTAEVETVEVEAAKGGEDA